MADGALGEVDEGAWDGEARALRLDGFDREQVAGTALDAPHDRFRRNARFGEIAGRVAPAVEIVLRRQRDAVGVDHRAFAQHVRQNATSGPLRVSPTD